MLHQAVLRHALGHRPRRRSRRRHATGTLDPRARTCLRVPRRRSCLRLGEDHRCELREGSPERTPAAMTGGDGMFLLRHAGVAVSFVVDVLVPAYLLKSSKRLKLGADDTKLDHIVLKDRAGAVHGEVADRSRSPICGVQVHLLADPADSASAERGSLGHGQVYHQGETASSFGTCVSVECRPVESELLSPTVPENCIRATLEARVCAWR